MPPKKAKKLKPSLIPKTTTPPFTLLTFLKRLILYGVPGFVIGDVISYYAGAKRYADTDVARLTNLANAGLQAAERENASAEREANLRAAILRLVERERQRDIREGRLLP